MPILSMINATVSPSVPDDAYRAFVMPCDLGSGPWRVGVKDCIDIAGFPTRQGSAVLADAPPAKAHAEVVRRLLDDGRWSLVGKTAMHEFAFGMTGVNARCGTPVNPHWPDRIPGGSSSGSAVAVAAGLVDMAVGSDTGGSVRLPAACCGVVGFKPSYGLVSRQGAYPEISSLDSIGVFARSVTMVEAAMEAIAPDFEKVRIDQVTLGVVQGETDADVLAAVRKALSVLPNVVRDLDGLEAGFVAGIALIGHESWNALKDYVEHPAMGEDIRARVLLGGAQTEEGLLAAQACRASLTAQVDAALQGVDALAMPTLPSVPPTLLQALDPRSVLPLSRFVRPFNLTGHPAITLPLTTAEGLPVGLQLVGRMGQDAALLAVARNVERLIAGATPFPPKSPSMQEN